MKPDLTEVLDYLDSLRGEKAETAHAVLKAYWNEGLEAAENTTPTRDLQNDLLRYLTDGDAEGVIKAAKALQHRGEKPRMGPIPDGLCIWFLRDNHTGIRIQSRSVAGLREELGRVTRENKYGMVGEAVLMSAGREMRRVRHPTIYTGDGSHLDRLAAQIDDWLDKLQMDPDAAQFLVPDLV